MRPFLLPLHSPPRRRAFGVCLYAAMACWLAGSAVAQGPGNSAAAQRAIEARLPPAASPTGGQGSPSDADIGAAVAKAALDFLAVALPPDLTPADVVGEAVRTRAGQLPAVEQILSAVTEALLTLDPDPGVRAVLDEAVTAACLAVTPGDVAELVRSQIALLATSPTAQSLLPKGPRPPDELLPIEAYAERIVAGGIKALRKVPTRRLDQHIQDVAARALTVAPPYLYEEIAAAAARTSSSGAVVLAPLTGGASNLLKTLLQGVPENPEDIGAIVAGVLRGRGAPVIAAVRVELANTRPAFASFTDAVLEGFRRCAGDQGEYHITYLRQEGAKFDRAGLITGAAARWPSEVQKFTQLALQEPGTNSTFEIARAAARAVPLLAPPTAAYCVGTRDVKPGELVQGFIEGAPAVVLGAIVGRQLTAMGTVAGENVRAVVAGAVAGAVGTGRDFTLPMLAREAARASRFPADVAEQGIAGAPPALRYVVGLGALAADVAPAAALTERISQLLAADPAQQAAFASGATAIARTQANLRDFLPATLSGLASAGSEAARIAVIHGVTLVNPRGAAAIAAAGIAGTDRTLWPAVIDAATQCSPGKAASIQLAAAAASGLRQSGSGGLTEHVLRSLFLHPSQASDIAAAAVIAAPGQAAGIARAAATRSGSATARMVPALLAFAQPGTSQTDAAARVATSGRIVAAVIAGLLEADLRERETGAITSSVDAAVLWACTTEAAANGTGPAHTVALLSAPQVTLAPGGLLETVIHAAVAASPRHGLAVARVTAETLTSFTRGQFTEAAARLSAIVREAGTLSFSGQPASGVETSEAIAFGITAHLAGQAGARALEVVNYSRSDGLGRPVTAFQDE